ncbi:hypothetical protein BpHYR1_028746 [Brachionus plicatilis]|uniref:Uncharacterized protein n=1 Tax=Brachionus plicatilis TaxID=10195 RepID=A0A3M7QLP7_BRAPC|nr:hypothetical protein BpHYR1_028746 [Brachionus plicatilis]
MINFCFIFNTYVRPILEYGSTIWNPNRKKDIKRIENSHKTRILEKIVITSFKEKYEIYKIDIMDRRLTLVIVPGMSTKNELKTTLIRTKIFFCCIILAICDVYQFEKNRKFKKTSIKEEDLDQEIF